MKTSVVALGTLRPGHLRFPVAVRDSRIDGRGAFALADIPARRKLGEIAGRLVATTEARELARAMERIAIVEIDDDVALDATVTEHPLRFVNHRCTPNAFLRIANDRVEIWSLRQILAGDEITADYGETHHEGRRPCTCGAPGCCGFI